MVRQTKGAVLLTYEVTLNFIRQQAPKVKAQTLRGYKSAAMWYAHMQGVPIPPEQSADLDKILNGVEVMKAEPRAVRGAPTHEQVQVLIYTALALQEPLLAAAVTVGYGIGSRARDLDSLEVWQVDLNANIVWVERKAPILTKVRFGLYQEKPIFTQEAIELLRRLVAGKGAHDKVLPGLSLTKVTDLVKEVAVRANWDPEVLWTGAHNLRHGCAYETYRAALEQARMVGPWNAEGMADCPYTRQARVQPGAAKVKAAHKAATAAEAKAGKRVRPLKGG